MCTGAETLMIGGGLTKVAGQFFHGSAQAAQSRAEAAGERDAAAQQSERILRATARRRGEARAATAASGARVDQFSLGIEQDIEQAGQTDAAMTILGGERRARALEVEARRKKAAGLNEVFGTLFSTGYAAFSGWKGIKQAPAPVEDRSFSSSSQDYRPNRAGR